MNLQEAQMRAHSQLQAGESLQWSGLTDARRAAFAAIPDAILFGGPFAGVALFCMYYGSMAPSAPPKPSTHTLPPGVGVLVFGLPFLAGGLINLLRPVWVYRTELDTVYAVTNQRVMIITDGGRSVRTLRDIAAVDHRERRDGSGDLVIRMDGSEYTRNLTTRRIVKIYGVSNVRDIARQILALRS